MVTYKKIWQVGYPVILGMIAQNLINLIDTAFLGRLGEAELGAGAIGGLFYYVLFMIGFGFGTGAQILISRRNGEKRFEDVGKLTDQTLITLSVFALFIFVIINLFASDLLGSIVSSPDVFGLSSRYLHIRNFGIFFAFMNVGARAFFVGITRTKVLSYGAIIMAVVNIVLDYALIFGHFGMPAMGIEGAALASVISEAVAVLYFFVYSKIFIKSSEFALYRFNDIRWKSILQIFDVSVWVMLQYFVSIATWFSFFLIIEQTGERNLAVSNIIRSIYMILIIPGFGFATAVNTLVSNSIGESGTKFVIPIIRKTVGLTFVISLLVMGITFLIPEWIIRVYTDSQALIEASVPVLYVVNGALPLLSLSIVIFFGLSGTGHTRVSMIIEFITAFCYLIYVYLLSNVFFVNVAWVWTSEYIYMFFLGLLSVLYFSSGKWKQKVL